MATVGSGSTRNAHGLSITELLVSTIMMSFCFSVIGELVVLNTLAATKLTNKTDGLTACRFAVERIKSDVRLGNAFISPDVGEEYNSLTIRQPVLYKDADPDSALNGFPIKGAQTIVKYKVIPDPQSTDEFLLQVTKTVLPANDVSTTTILRGITGPLDTSNPTKVKIFRYIESKWSQPIETEPGQFSAAFSTSMPSMSSTMYSGASIDLEVKRGTDNKRFASTFGSHAEAFLKFNRNAEDGSL